MLINSLLGLFGGNFLSSLLGFCALGWVEIDEGAWPSFEVPEGVGGEHTPAAAAEPAAPAAPAAAAQPAAPAANAVQPGQPAAGQPAQPVAGQPQGVQPGQQLPQYRINEILAREQALRDENARFKSAMAVALGFTPDGKPAPAAEDPRTLQLRDTIYKLVPGLKEILEKREALMNVAENAPTWASQNDAYWQTVAVRTMGSVYDGVALLMLGEGKTRKDLDVEFVEDVRDGFLKWCERDKTGQRVARYEGSDPTLVTDFLKTFGARYVDPVRRSAAATVAVRGAAVSALPVSGAAGMPAASQPPKVDNSDEDAVHGRGWAVAQSLRSA